jgi:dCMP deaminase
MLNWDDLFMNMVYLIAEKSKDEKTHVGAVIIGPDHEVRSVGYNSFPRKINDNLSNRQERPEKYFWMSHAEANAVANSAMIGISLKGCILYTNGIPCTSCATLIINAGIKEVVVDKKWESNNSEKWIEHANRTKIMIMEANVKLRFWGGELLNIHRFCDGEILK